MTHCGGNLKGALEKLDRFADGAEFLLGHNLIAFDIPHLKAAQPNLRLLKLPVIDTLLLSPLAFPGNPYHSLVKHYKDGGLKRGAGATIRNSMPASATRRGRHPARRAWRSSVTCKPEAASCNRQR